jgi:hypothetical protein
MTILRNAALCVTLLCMSSSIALADCEVVAINHKTAAKVWQCEPPAASQTRPKCWHVSGVLLCSGEIGQEIPSNRVTPQNCGWRKDKYVCG